jgi:hypothetical protein
MNKQRKKQKKQGMNSHDNGRLMSNRTQKAVLAPVAQNRSSRQSGTNRRTYRESERIQTINGSSDFKVVANVPCNPALSGSFPWLSGHGALYEKYHVKKLVYRYKNLKGTTTDGNILMSFDYDTMDAPPSTAIEVTQSTVWEDGAPWRIFELHVPCHRTDLFTRTGLVQDADLKTYDFGRLFVSAEGCSDDSAHGYLEVDYVIDLHMKQASVQTPVLISRLSTYTNSTQSDIPPELSPPLILTCENPVISGNLSDSLEFNVNGTVTVLKDLILKMNVQFVMAVNSGCDCAVLSEILIGNQPLSPRRASVIKFNLPGGLSPGLGYPFSMPPLEAVMELKTGDIISLAISSDQYSSSTVTIPEKQAVISYELVSF